MATDIKCDFCGEVTTNKERRAWSNADFFNNVDHLRNILNDESSYNAAPGATPKPVPQGLQGLRPSDERSVNNTSSSYHH
jgi:hypothetical protein